MMYLNKIIEIQQEILQGQVTYSHIPEGDIESKRMC
jgi:hypothetical protein